MTNIEIQACRALIEIPRQLQKLNENVEELRSLINHINCDRDEDND